MQYRVTINIRRKGEGVMDGVELKTELHDDLEHLLDVADEFIESKINEDLECNDG